MILERHLRALLKRFGIDEYGAPGMDQWLGLLSHLSDQLRRHEDEKHRLQRSLEIHGRELQSLYRELVTERDHLSSALACLSQGFLIFNAQGQPLLMNAEAEQWLGWSEHEVSGHNFLEMLQLEQVLQLDDLQQRLADGRSAAGRGFFSSRDGSRFLAQATLQPVLREGQLAGSVLTFEPPGPEQAPPLRLDPAGALDDIVMRMRKMLQDPTIGAAESSLRAIIREAEEALVLLDGEAALYATQEELAPVPEPALALAAAESPPSASIGQSTPLAATSTPPPVLPPKAQPAVPEQADPPPPPPAPLPEVVRQPPPAKVATRGLRVLLVEDEAVSQMVTESVLEKLGHQCTVAENGLDALRLHQQSPFDAIISTYLMPGMDGIALCRQIREDPQGGYPYFILLTAMDKREEATRALEAGVDAFLTKPLDANDLAIRLKVAKGVQTRLTRVYSEFAAGGEV